MAAVEVRLLGPAEVLVDGVRVTPAAPKVRMLLAMLALDAGTSRSSDELADRLWRGAPPDTSGSIVRTYVSQLRRLLPDGAERLERTGDGYALRLAPDELDVSRFEALIDEAKRRGPNEASVVLRQAMALWRGTPLPELVDDARGQAATARLVERRWEAIAALADVELGAGRHERLVPDLEAAVAEEPLREQLVAKLMVALYRSGRQADALAAFQRLRRGLADELGLDPSPELRRLEVAILEHDPALAAPARRVGNLPAQAASFVGRDDEIEQLAAALGSHRLVTATGPGGSGKTRLAIEVARRHEERAGGAWFVDLQPLRHAHQVAPAVAAALGLEERRREDPMATLTSSLQDRSLLLVLDNCEHLVPACSRLAGAVAAAAPDVTILATSRVPLGVPGELVWPVAGLATPAPDASPAAIAASPAGRLLSDRVASARGGHPPSEREWPAMGELCRRLDGLPLALELVASQAGALGLDALAAAPAAAVDGAVLGVPLEHHRSLRACVEWSVDLLDQDDRRLLESVSLLPGAFSAAAAAAVAGRADDGRVLPGLARLVRQSLLQAEGTVPQRFRMLDTIRHVVRTGLDEQAAQAAMERLLGWGVTWARAAEPALRGPDATRVLAEFDADREGLRLALEHGLQQADPSDGVRIAASISGVWSYRGQFAEGQRWLEQAVAVADRVDRALRAEVMVAAATHAMTLGDDDLFRRRMGEALELSRVAADAPRLTRALLWSARAATVQGDLTAAESLYREALSIAEREPDHSAVGSALAGLGDVAVAGGDVDEGIALHLRSLAAFRAAADPHGEGQALLNVADAERLSGRLDEAERRFAAASETFESIGDRSCITATREGLARIAVDRGRLDEAERLLRAAVDSRRQLDQHQAAARALRSLAAVLAAAGRPLEAASVLGAAGDDHHPLAAQLREDLGERAYLAAWADGAVSRSDVRT